MKKPTHPLFQFPGSLLWLIPLFGLVFFYWSAGSTGPIFWFDLDPAFSLWWYITIPILIALALIELFTTVWLGITILATLFLFSSIGSSGVPISFANMGANFMGKLA